MRRYIRLYKAYISRAIQARLAYKADTFVGIISFIIDNAASFLCIVMITQSIPSLNGWTIEELALLYGFAMLPKGLDHLFTDSLWNIGYWYVRRGLFDKQLIRPVSPLFQTIAETFQPEAFGEIIIGLTLCIVYGLRINIAWSFDKVLLLIVAVIFGALIFTGVKLITCSIAFWTKRSGQLMNAVYNCSDFAKYPISIYNKALQIFLAFIVPFGLVISIPVEQLLRGEWNSYAIIGMIVLFALVFNGLGYLMWKLGVRAYESSGS